MLNRVKWPHEVVVCLQGKTTVYEDISLALFSNGYLSVVSEETPSIQGYMLIHLRQIFEDVDVYGLRLVCEYHAARLQLLEQGRAEWSDEQKRSELCALWFGVGPLYRPKIPNPLPTRAPQTPVHKILGRGAGRAFYHSLGHCRM